MDNEYLANLYSYIIYATYGKTAYQDELWLIFMTSKNLT